MRRPGGAGNGLRPPAFELRERRAKSWRWLTAWPMRFAGLGSRYDRIAWRSEARDSLAAQLRALDGTRARTREKRKLSISAAVAVLQNRTRHAEQRSYRRNRAALCGSIKELQFILARRNDKSEPWRSDGLR